LQLRLNSLFDFLILQSDTDRMNSSETANNAEWLKTPSANLVRYKSSGMYFARFRVRGKLIRRSLKTSKISVAKLRLADLEKQERQRAEQQTAVAEGAGLCRCLGDLQAAAGRRWYFETAQQGIPGRANCGFAQIMAGFGKNRRPEDIEKRLFDMGGQLRESGCTFELQQYGRYVAFDSGHSSRGRCALR